MRRKIIIIILLIVCWCGVIFYASHKTSDESNSTSKNIIYGTLKNTLTITNKIGITNFKLSKNNLMDLTNKFNYPVRKIAHATVYFILAVLLMILFYLLGYRNFKVMIVAIGICFLYSLTDEYHQTFVLNRTGQFSDCLIDTFGAILGVITINFIFKIKNRKLS